MQNKKDHKYMSIGSGIADSNLTDAHPCNPHLQSAAHPNCNTCNQSPSSSTSTRRWDPIRVGEVGGVFIFLQQK